MTVVPRQIGSDVIAGEASSPTAIRPSPGGSHLHPASRIPLNHPSCTGRRARSAQFALVVWLPLFYS